MLAYVDSSALFKRVIDEIHSTELKARLEEIENGAGELISSTLGWIEVSRGLKRRFSAQELGDRDAKALAGVGGFPISYEVVGVARRIGSPELRSLDAIHCATALVSQSDLVLTYDTRLIEAAADCGLRTESPGA